MRICGSTNYSNYTLREMRDDYKLITSNAKKVRRYRDKISTLGTDPEVKGIFLDTIGLTDRIIEESKLHRPFFLGTVPKREFAQSIRNLGENAQFLHRSIGRAWNSTESYSKFDSSSNEAALYSEFRDFCCLAMDLDNIGHELAIRAENTPDSRFFSPKIVLPAIAALLILVLLALGHMPNGIQIGPLSFPLPWEQENANKLIPDRTLNKESKACILEQIQKLNPSRINLVLFGSFEIYADENISTWQGVPPNEETIIFARDVASFLKAEGYGVADTYTSISSLDVEEPPFRGFLIRGSDIEGEVEILIGPNDGRIIGCI